MIENLLHFLGICPDSLSHPSLLWLLTGGVSVGIRQIVLKFFPRSLKTVRK